MIRVVVAVARTLSKDAQPSREIENAKKQQKEVSVLRLTVARKRLLCHDDDDAMESYGCMLLTFHRLRVMIDAIVSSALSFLLQRSSLLPHEPDAYARCCFCAQNE
jgi:hypothetical protein